MQFGVSFPIPLNKFRRANLKRKLIVLISFTMMVILLYCFMVFVITSYKNSRRDLNDYLRSSYSLKEKQLDAYLTRLDYTAYSIMFSNWVQRLMVIDRVVSLAEFQEYQRNVTHFLSSLSSINDDLSFVLLSGSTMVWSNNRLRYDLQYDITKQPWFNKLTDRNKYIEYGRSELFAGLDDRWSMTFYYPVISYYNFSLLGYLAINVTGENLDFMLATGGNDREEWIVLRDRGGNTILSNMPAGNGHEITGPGWLSLTEPLMDGQWTIDIFIRNNVNPFSGLGSLNLIFLFLIPIIILFIMIITAFSRYLTIPIVKCKNAMLEIRNKNFGITLENHYQDEIGGLISGFNDMSEDLVLLIRKNAESNALRREAEIDMLQQKVNPHFLYNTLEIINALILGKQNSSAVQVCELLGKIYHYNLMKRKWVSLGEECEYVKRYLNILKYNMNNLSVVWEVDEEALKTAFLKLILQPLVENAVLHGLRSRQGDACLTISVKRREGVIELLIMDNGSGIEAGNLADIEKNLAAVRRGTTPDSPHIGIPNVYQRLYLEYGDAMEFSVESRLNYGTKIIIVLPV
ncbi:MAG: histidine kinase [Spirochaetaceae bacterium]|jgi:two-component system sensor histidine kinase YesM|nr:histidine kinase [Spirochaetaceae bacterium]